VLSELEEAQLRQWAAMVPEPPDLSIDPSVIDPIIDPIVTEDTNDVEATQGPARPAIPPIEAGAGSGDRGVPEGRGSAQRADLAASEAEADRPSAADPPENVVILPQILPIAGPLGRRRPAELDGWETD
jgi:hypothetical protein